jgi:hypothetical protein
MSEQAPPKLDPANIPSAAEYCVNILRVLIQSDGADAKAMLKDGMPIPPESMALLLRMREGVLRYEKARELSQGSPFSSLLSLATQQIAAGNAGAARDTLYAMRRLLDFAPMPTAPE